MKKYLCFYLLTGSIVFSNGCVSNKAIQEFATASAEATSRLPKLAGDLPESCIRQKQYLAIRDSDFDPTKLRQQAEDGCADFRSSEKNFVVASKVLIEYLQVLSKLSGGEVITYDKNLDKLSANVGEAKFFPKEKVTVVNAVVKFLGQVAADKWRRKQINKAIVTVNPDLQILLSTLSTNITNDYSQLLQIEQLAAKNLYLGTIKENKNKEPATIVLLQHQWDTEYKTLENRKKTGSTYGEILTTIAQTHQLLVDKQDKLNKKEVKKAISDYTAKLTSLNTDIKDTF